MTALAATVGTGNIAGVATAIAAGGPGALFWMWITGLVGMATKFAEAVLAVRYRVTDSKGQMSGGPMYYLRRGLNSRFLAAMFAVTASIAAFGIGNMVQANSVADAVEDLTGSPPLVTGLVLSFATALVLLGGVQGIARTASTIVPVMIVLYIGGAVTILVLSYDRIPEIFWLVLSHAFRPTAAAGGFLGATVRQTIRYGVARGVFSNESGLGSSPIAAAAARTRNPTSQALVSMTQTFIDTLVVCSMTGFVILLSGQWTSGLDGAELTANAFRQQLPGGWGGALVTVGLALFAYSTILGWSYYGEKSLSYLFGDILVLPYRLLFCVVVIFGAVSKLDFVWAFSDMMNGMMAIPNLIGLLLLSRIVRQETDSYFRCQV
jgi:AGCS family alanine or glycine:cation symporter